MTFRTMAVILSLCGFMLCGCSKRSNETRVVMTRWIKQDTSLVYTLHRYSWESDTRRYATTPRTSEITSSTLRFYIVDLTRNDSITAFGTPRLLLKLEHAVPCPGLHDDTASALITIAYLARDQAKPGDCPLEGTRSDLRVVAGILADSLFTPALNAFDTSAALAKTRTPEATTPDVLIRSGLEICLSSEGPCLKPYLY